MEIIDAIYKEQKRQQQNIELIASENFVSPAVSSAVGSCLTNKYCEGYPEQESIDAFISTHQDFVYTGNVGRYYGGCSCVDEVELLAQHYMQKAFHTDYHVNVQPHSGSQANSAAYMAVLKPGDTILSMSLDNGGHLTHGSKVNFSGKTYNFIHYGVDQNGLIDYEDLRSKVEEHKPQLVLAGASAYSREIDFDRIKDIIGDRAIFMVDMAHIAGLVAAGYHKSPFGVADIITTTTHKTLRGPRGGVIFCKPELAKKIDSAVFPGTQGGPLMHVIAGKAICAEEATTKEFREYIRNVVENTKAMANEFISLGYKVVTGGTDNHLLLLDLSDLDVTGAQVQKACDENHITLNKNCVPNEKRSPKQTSGVRIGCAAMTTKGFTANDFIRVAHQIDEIIHSIQC